MGAVSQKLGTLHYIMVQFVLDRVLNGHVNQIKKSSLPITTLTVKIGSETRGQSVEI